MSGPVNGRINVLCPNAGGVNSPFHRHVFRFALFVRNIIVYEATSIVYSQLFHVR